MGVNWIRLVVLLALIRRGPLRMKGSAKGTLRMTIDAEGRGSYS